MSFYLANKSILANRGATGITAKILPNSVISVSSKFFLSSSSSSAYELDFNFKAFKCKSLSIDNNKRLDSGIVGNGNFRIFSIPIDFNDKTTESNYIYY